MFVAAITARGVEMIHAIAEAIAIIEAYQPPADAGEAWEPRAGVASWASEAPRGRCSLTATRWTSRAT